MLTRLLQVSPLVVLLAVVASFVASLSACGGNSRDTASTVVVPPPILYVSGTVADGMAWHSAKVQLRCQNGSAEATTDEHGHYEAKMVGANLPCAVRVTLAYGAKLHALKIGEGQETVVNVTPLTELLVIRLAHRDAGQFYDGFDPAQTNLNALQIQDATKEIKTVLSEFVDLSSLNNFVTDKLLPSTVRTLSSDPHNEILKRLKERLDPLSLKDLLSILNSSAPISEALPFPASLIVLTSRLELKENWRFQLAVLTAYSAHLQLNRPPVVWSVVEADGGTIDPVTGLYTAPNKSGVFHVKAQSELKPDLSALVEVRVQNFGALPFYAKEALNLPAQNWVVRNAETWKLAQEKFNLQLVGTLPEAIDFNQHMLLIVYHGGGSDGCAGVNIHAWQPDTPIQTLVYDLKGNTEPELLCAQSFSFPIKVLMVARSELPVDFMERK